MDVVLNFSLRNKMTNVFDIRVNVKIGSMETEFTEKVACEAWRSINSVVPDVISKVVDDCFCEDNPLIGIEIVSIEKAK